MSVTLKVEITEKNTISKNLEIRFNRKDCKLSRKCKLNGINVIFLKHITFLHF